MKMNSMLPDTFWGYSVSEIIRMDYNDLSFAVLEASKMSYETVVEVIARRRAMTSNHAEILACNRIISAMIDGPDVLEC